MNKLCLKTLPMFFRRQSQGKHTVSLFRYPNNYINLDQNFYFLNKFEDLKYLAAVKLSSWLQQKRSNSTNSGEGDQKKKPNLLMNFEPVMRPEFLLTLKNWIIAKFIIQPYLDKDFTTRNFTNGAKQAIGVVSSLLSQGDFQSLKGLVADDVFEVVLAVGRELTDFECGMVVGARRMGHSISKIVSELNILRSTVSRAITEIKRNFSSLTVKERQDLIIKVTDILFAFPHQIGIIFDDNNQKRFAEITVVYHCMNDFEELKAQGKVLTENSKDDVKICNYRFIREYTKGVESDWTINRLGHFKLCHFEN